MTVQFQSTTAATDQNPIILEIHDGSVASIS